MGPQPYSGERRGAVRAAAKLERKICIFCHPRPASARAWLSGYLVLDLSWTLSRSSDTVTWRQLGDNLVRSCHIIMYPLHIECCINSPENSKFTHNIHNIYATPCMISLDTEQAIFTQLSEPLFGAWWLVPGVPLCRDNAGLTSSAGAG